MKTILSVDIKGKQHEVAVDALRWRPSVYAIIIHDGKLLLATEADGRYTLPGGGIELGEPLEEALVREVREETGMSIANPRPVSFASNFFTLTGSLKGRHVQSLLLYYLCDFAGGDLTLEHLPEEDRPFHGESEWLPLERLPSVELASSFDWRPLVERIVNENHRY